MSQTDPFAAGVSRETTDVSQESDQSTVSDEEVLPSPDAGAVEPTEGSIITDVESDADKVKEDIEKVVDEAIEKIEDVAKDV